MFCVFQIDTQESDVTVNGHIECTTDSNKAAVSSQANVFVHVSILQLEMYRPCAIINHHANSVQMNTKPVAGANTLKHMTVLINSNNNYLVKGILAAAPCSHAPSHHRPQFCTTVSLLKCVTFLPNIRQNQIHSSLKIKSKCAFSLSNSIIRSKYSLKSSDRCYLK